MAGQVDATWEGGFPKYVWVVRGGICFEGRLVNSVQGHYKGYPLDETQWPRGLQ